MSDFHERFGLPVDIEAERQKFINRVCDHIFDTWDFFYKTTPPSALNIIFQSIAFEFGIRHDKKMKSIYNCINENNYFEVLHGIEVLYKNDPYFNIKSVIDRDMNDHIISKSESDLGIRWENGKFIRTGAKLFDDELLNDPLKWLRRKGHPTIIEPFEKARHHFLEAESQPKVLSDVITDAYEALEALAKIVLDNNQELSKNREKFVSKIKGKEFHKKILKEYVDYGCKYRHAADPKAPRPQPTIAEAEFFLYFTGTFIRLAMENWEDA